MTTAIVLMALVALAVHLSVVRPSGPFAGPAPVDRDRERLLDELRARR